MSHQHINFVGVGSAYRNKERTVLLVVVNNGDSAPIDLLSALLPDADIVPTGLQPELFADLDPATARAQLPLTARQLEILHYLTKGLTNKEIGRILGISNFTVRNHVSKLLHALNVSKRKELRAPIAECVGAATS